MNRTTCACDDCRACCKRQPGMLGVGDLQRLARAVPDPAGKFVPSKGALLLDTRTGKSFRVGTITPARKPDGSCVFLDDQERCTVHEIAPQGCALFDTHMDAAEGNRRSAAVHTAIAASREYQMQRESLLREHDDTRS